jgi:hypothetical protein
VGCRYGGQNGDQGSEVLDVCTEYEAFLNNHTEKQYYEASLLLGRVSFVLLVLKE